MNQVSINGQLFDSIAEAGRSLGLPTDRVYRRVNSKLAVWDDWKLTGDPVVRPKYSRPSRIRVPVVYFIQHVPTGQFYVGSTDNVEGRKATHIYRLKKGTHVCKKLQQLWTEDSDEANWVWPILLCDDREAAYTLEQKFMDDPKNDSILLNSVRNARSPISEVTARSGYDARHREAVRHRESLRTPEEREQVALNRSRAGVERWAQPGAREARSGGGNPFAKRVEVDGVVYGAMKEAMRVLDINEKTIRKRVNSDLYPTYRFV